MSHERSDSFTDTSSAATKNQTASRGPGLPSQGLPRARRQKSYDSLGLRRYASSGSQSTSPVPSSGFPNNAGTLRVPGGITPVLPGDGRSPFRFLPPNEDGPMTPMDISPVTPRTPRFGLSDFQPQIAGSSPSSPDSDDYLSIDFHVHSGLSRDEKKDVSFQAKSHSRHPSEPIPVVHVSRGASQAASGRSTPYETALAEEDYAAAYAAHFIAASTSSSPSDPPYRGRERVRAADLNRGLQRLSTRSLSPPRHRFGSPIERPFATTATTDAQRHVDSSTSQSPKVGEATSPIDRSNDFDFAAARDARMRFGHSDIKPASPLSNHRHTPSNNSENAAYYPIPKPTNVDPTPAASTGRPKITPTPRAPVLLRLGSKLKSEVKGAFNRKADNAEPASGVKETKLKISAPKVEKVEALHWTDY
ncbi:hypothetical protein NA57DRAFT_52560 [Rhizodiscina lignyota]|uniref:Uncharacterized protein n=1 Tax=Rhizodiscina lignyota TaxID=1504668 RepID=A0A9P4IRN5_9PEZI|nr:hypothetical protein NA57DRAFT_52560 [Rhizodiscina lignyota]